MTIKSQTTLADYRKLMIELTYRKPSLFIFSGIAVIISLLTLGKTGINFEAIKSILIFVILLFVFSYASVYYSSKKVFQSHKRLQEKVAYELAPDKLIVTGESFKSELQWQQVYKIKELKNWFLVYESKQVAILISKKNLSTNEISAASQFFREIKARFKK